MNVRRIALSRIVGLFAFSMWSVSAVALEGRESLGTLKIDDLVLRPQFEMREPGEGQFRMGESLFSLRWSMDPQIHAIVSVGSSSLLGESLHYNLNPVEETKVIEAYAVYTTNYGIFKAGLQPVGFGVEGRRRESDLSFHRSLFFQKRLVPLRDLGLSYEVDFNGYFTSLIVHNGESGEDLDSRLWYTGAWGWRSPDRVTVGIAGDTGSTTPSSTLTSGDTLASVDPSKGALWRMGGLFARWTPPLWAIDLEAYVGELAQERRQIKFSVGHFAIEHDFAAQASVLVRYDHFDPNLKMSSDLERQISLGFGFKSRRGNSRLYLIGTKVLDPAGQVPNDELRLIWHVTPLIDEVKF